MAVEIKSDQITGITTATSSTDAVYKQYVDDRATVIPGVISNENESLFTNGSVVSWEPLSGYVEYDAAGTYNFTIPSNAELVTISATGAGGGGASGSSNPSNYKIGSVWSFRTSGAGSTIWEFLYIQNGGIYMFAGSTRMLRVSTNGIQWIARTVGNSLLGNAVGLASIPTIAQKYIIGGVGGNGILSSSTDTINWTARTVGLISTTIFSATEFGTPSPNLYVISGSAGAVSVSTDAIHWRSRTSGISGAQNILRIRYYPSEFATGLILIANLGQVATSTDSINWTNNILSGSPSLYDVAYGNGIYVVVGSNGLHTSTNSVIWSLRTIGTAVVLSGVDFGENIFAATTADSSYSRVRTSTDGIVWFQRGIVGTNSSAGSIRYLNGSFFANTGQLIGYSPSYTLISGFAGGGGGGGATATWKIPSSFIQTDLTVTVGSGGTAATDGGNTTVSWNGDTSILTLNGGKGGSTNGDLLGGAGGIEPSANTGYLYAAPGGGGGPGLIPIPGTTLGELFNNTEWTAPSSLDHYQSMSTGGGGGYASPPIVLPLSSTIDEFRFFGCTGGVSSLYGSNINTASRNYTNANSPIVNGYPVSSGANGGGATLIDASYWILRTVGLRSTSVSKMRYLNDNYFICTQNGMLHSSTNGISWTLLPLPLSNISTSNLIHDIAYGNGIYVISAGTSQTGILASTDLITWERRTVGTADSRIAVTIKYGNNEFIYGGGSPFILNHSTDSIHWTFRTTSNFVGSLKEILYHNSNYYVIGANGVLIVSTNTIHWTLRTVGTLNTLEDINIGNGIFNIGTTVGQQLFSSTNGIEWRLRTTTITSGPIRYTFGNITHLIGGGGGFLCISTDTIHWIRRTSGTVNSCSSLLFSQDLFLSANSNVLLTSPKRGLVGDGGDGKRGSGGGGGGYNGGSTLFGIGGKGGDGYVRISWV